MLTLVLQAQTSIVAPNAAGIATPRPALAPEIAMLLRQLVMMLGSFGILGLWYLDQRVYQRLLHAAFAYGCHMEATLRTLPAVRMFMFGRAGDVTSRLGRFYTIPVWLLLLAGALNLAFAAPATLADLQASVAQCWGDLVACARAPTWIMGTVIYILQAIPTLIVMGSSTGWRDLAKLLPDIMKRETLNAARADALDRLKP